MEPRPEVRERVLRVCRDALAERIAADRRGGRRRAWGLALAAILLCLINGLEERRHAARMADLQVPTARMVEGSRENVSLLASLQARAARLAAMAEEGDAPGSQEQIP